ncbi:LacI family DNA-binding transcriptional regulator [Alphaproteobacteria bacterium]|nr:LacI family DNA-binding transcriptional regulator [Alphaproteobacteria bacterium]
MKPVSLKFLAKELGLSQGTVSRALNDYPDISDATRQRVLLAAEKYNYNANQAARRLATGVAEAVGYLMPSNTGSIAEPFVAQLLEGLGQSVSKRGWDLLVVQAPSVEQEADAIKKLAASGKVSGIVLSRPHKNDDRITLLQNSNLPFIVLGRGSNSDNYAWYDVDGEGAFFTLVEHLVCLGHSRIGFIGAPPYFDFSQMRLDGYKDGLAKNGIAFDDSLVEFAEMSDSAGERAAICLLGLNNPPTGILCATDTQAIGVLAAIRSKGLVPGRDISVIGFDGLAIGKHTNPPLTTMAQPLAHAGRQIGDMLLAIIDGGDPKDFQKLQSAEFVRRMSDGPRPILNQ